MGALRTFLRYSQPNFNGTFQKLKNQKTDSDILTKLDGYSAYFRLLPTLKHFGHGRKWKLLLIILKCSHFSDVLCLMPPNFPGNRTLRFCALVRCIILLVWRYRKSTVWMFGARPDIQSAKVTVKSLIKTRERSVFNCFNHCVKISTRFSHRFGRHV